MSLINIFIECICIFFFWLHCVNFNSGYFLQDATEWFFFQSHSVQLQFRTHSTVVFSATVSHLWWHIFLCRKYFPEFNTYPIFINLVVCTFTLLVHLHTCNLPSKFIKCLLNLIIYLNFQSLQTWQNKTKVSYLYTPIRYIVVSDTSQRNFLTFPCSQVSATSHLLWKHVKKIAMKLIPHYFPHGLLQKQPQVFKSNLRGARTDMISAFNIWFGKKNYKLRKLSKNCIMLVFYIPFPSVSFHQFIFTSFTPYPAIPCCSCTLPH